MKTIPFGHQGKKQCENLTCCILFEDHHNSQVSRLHNIAQSSDTEQGERAGRTYVPYTHTKSYEEKNNLATLQRTNTHSPHTRSMDESWYQALFAPRWGRGHTVGLPQHRRPDNAMGWEVRQLLPIHTSGFFFFIYISCTDTYTHNHTENPLTSVAWNVGLGREVGVQNKARELSEECIQQTLDRMEVQMRALIMQAEHKGGNISIQAIQGAEHKSKHILHLLAVCAHTRAKCVGMKISSSLLKVEYCYYAF